MERWLFRMIVNGSKCWVQSTPKHRVEQADWGRTVLRGYHLGKKALCGNL